MRKARRPLAVDIEVELDGKTWSGRYLAGAGEVDVWCEYGRKSTRTGGLPDAELARVLLLELIQDRAGRHENSAAAD